MNRIMEAYELMRHNEKIFIAVKDIAMDLSQKHLEYEKALELNSLISEYKKAKV